MSYGPNQSLYEGTYHGDADDFSQFQPLSGSLPLNELSNHVGGGFATPRAPFRNSRLTSGDSSQHLVSLIQEQQKALAKILDNQKIMETKQNGFEKQLLDLQQQVEPHLLTWQQQQ